MKLCRTKSVCQSVKSITSYEVSMPKLHWTTCQSKKGTKQRVTWYLNEGLQTVIEKEATTIVH